MITIIAWEIAVLVILVFVYFRFVSWNTLRKDKNSLALAWPEPFEKWESGKKVRFMTILLKDGDSYTTCWFQKIGCRTDQKGFRRLGIYYGQPGGVSGSGYDYFLAGNYIKEVKETSAPPKPYWL